MTSLRKGFNSQLWRLSSMFSSRADHQHADNSVTQQDEFNPSVLYSEQLATERSPSIVEERTSTNQMSPLLQFLEMEDTKDAHKLLGSLQKPLSPALDFGLSSVGLPPSDLLDQLSPPAVNLHVMHSSGTSPISMYFPDYSLDDVQRTIPDMQATKSGLPVEQLIASSEIAEMERTLDTCAGKERYSTSKEGIKGNAIELDFGLEESLPELSPAESAANRLRRYEIRRRQRTRTPPEASTNPGTTLKTTHSNRFSASSFASVEPSLVSPAGIQQQLQHPKSTYRQDNDLSVSNLHSANGSRGFTPKRFISPIKGRRKNRDKMLELEQVNAMLRSKVDYLFAEMGQLKNPPASFPGSEAVTSQLTSYGRAQAQLANTERDHAASGDTSHPAARPELRRDNGRVFGRP